MASGPQSAVAAQRQPLLIVADYLDSRRGLVPEGDLVDW